MRISVLFLALTIAATATAADDSPDMIHIPAGEATIGSNNGLPDERPVHRVRVEAFRLDRTLVTVEAFSRYVSDTGAVTEAERCGDGAVLDAATGQWQLLPGANWRQPLGPKGPAALSDHPVTQVSWNDAGSYCAWAGKRLPTERVQRGGSFLCSPEGCHGFRVSARGKSTPDSTHMHVGFRCAAGPEATSRGDT